MIKLERSFWWVLAIIIFAFFISRFPSTASNPIFLRLVYVMVILLVVNLLWSIFSIIGLDINRISRVSRKQVGEVFTENFEIINHSFIPKAWVKISDQADLLGRAGSRALTWIGGGRSRIYVADSLLKKRGWFHLGPTVIETGDVLVIASTGAYGYSMSSNYNKIPKAAVVSVQNGKSRVICKRQTLEELLALEVL